MLILHGNYYVINMDWKNYGHVLSSNYRKRIMLLLITKPLTPKEITLKSELHFSHVSSTLKDLSCRGIVINLTPNLRKGKIYGLTSEGKEVVEKILE